MLGAIDPDYDYDIWRNICWAVAASGLSVAENIAHDWSATGALWDEGAFDTVWHSYDPSRDKAVGFGTLVHYARAAGYTGPIPQPPEKFDKLEFGQSNSSPQVTTITAKGLMTQRASDIEPEPVEWLIQGAQDDQDDQGAQHSQHVPLEHLGRFDEASAQFFQCPLSPRVGCCNVRKPPMPLPNITSGTTQRCAAKCKARGGAQCLNPAAYGMNVCRYHGARMPETVRRGASHPQYRHGGETLEAKAERSRRLAELHRLEALSYALGLATGPRWRGRKPSHRS